MPVTVARLVAVPELGLSVHTGDVGLGREVRWAATSELLDPTPFLEGGELLLSTGMHLPVQEPKIGDYFDRLVHAGVSAFGLGLGLTLDEVPPAVVDAAASRALPLLVVPRPTPFIAVTRALADMIATEQRDDLSRALQVQRRLVDAALTPEGSQAVLRVLASSLEGWAALLDVTGAVRLSAGEGAYQRSAALTADAARIGSRSLHASAAVDIEGGHAVLQPVGSGGRVTGVLAVGGPQRFSPTRRAAVAGAVAVLSLEPDRARHAVETGRATRAAILRLLLLGRLEDANSVAAAAGLALPAGPVRVLLVRPTAGGAGSLLSRLEDIRMADDPQPVCALLDDRIVAVFADEARVLEAVTGVLESVPGARAGISQPGPLDEVGSRVESARQALGAAVQGGRAWINAGQLGSVRLLGLLHPDLLAGHADTVLAPLASYGRNQNDLLVSLRAWLEHGGHWDETAAALGVHRNTLRYRIRRIEQLTGRDLSSMSDRVELWLALQGRDLVSGDRSRRVQSDSTDLDELNS